MIETFLLLLAQSRSEGCDLAGINTERELREALGRRAVEVVSAAANGDAKSDARLHALIDQAAEFDLGSGDVGLPLGRGVAGARSLAAAMKADEYRLLGWDYMDGPAEGCGKHSITVEFVSSRDRLLSKVDFSFDHGRVIMAKGWRHSFKSGSLPVPKSWTW